MTLGTVVRGRLIRVVAAVIFAVTEEPGWYTPVVVHRRTFLPSRSAVAVPALVRWLIRIVTAVIIEVAVPKFWYTLSIVAFVLCVSVALLVMTDGRIFIRSVSTIVIAITLPRDRYTSTSVLALEIVFTARVTAKLLITLVPTVIVAIANLNPWHAGGIVMALELALLARECRTSHFVRTVSAILLSVTLPKHRDAAVV